MIIYKQYTRKELDRQYNARASVPDFAQVLESWKLGNRRARQDARLYEDLRYGTGERESVDLFVSPEPGSALLVFFHGGYWQAMDKTVFHFIVDDFLRQGVSVALPNYPLAPSVPMDAIVESCRKAMAWLYRHAGEYDCDGNRLFACGHSAGGHLTAMLMATKWDRFAAGLPADLIKGGCALSGLFDLHPIRLSFLNGVLGMDEAAAERNSPLYQAPACEDSVIVSVGAEESDEFHAQSGDFASAWAARGIAVEMMIIGGANHFSLLDHFSNRSSKLHRAIIQQIYRQGAKGASLDS